MGLSLAILSPLGPDFTRRSVWLGAGPRRELWVALVITFGLHALVVLVLGLGLGLNHIRASQPEPLPLVVEFLPPPLLAIAAAPPPPPPPRVKSAPTPPPPAPIPREPVTPVVPPVVAPRPVEPIPASRVTSPEPVPSPPVIAPTALIENVPPAFHAEYLHNPEPEYPRAAKRLGLKGKVMLKVSVDAAGVPTSIEIAQSSGVKILDDAAAKGVQAWRFVPARQGNAPIAGSVFVPIRFGFTER